MNVDLAVNFNFNLMCNLMCNLTVTFKSLVFDYFWLSERGGSERIMIFLGVMQRGPGLGRRVRHGVRRWTFG